MTALSIVSICQMPGATRHPFEGCSIPWAARLSGSPVFVCDHAYCRRQLIARRRGPPAVLPACRARDRRFALAQDARRDHPGLTTIRNAADIGWIRHPHAGHAIEPARRYRRFQISTVPALVRHGALSRLCRLVCALGPVKPDERPLWFGAHTLASVRRDFVGSGHSERSALLPADCCGRDDFRRGSREVYL